MKMAPELTWLKFGGAGGSLLIRFRKRMYEGSIRRRKPDYKSMEIEQSGKQLAFRIE
jgi:hypothetical protein